MRKRTATAMLGLLAAGLATAGTAHAAPTELAGTNVITGSESGVTRVVVPRPATVLGDDSFAATGNGRFQGFLLRRAGAAPTDGFSVVGAQTNLCFEAGCSVADGRWVRDIWSNGDEAAPSLAVPAGSYDLYLIADGVPASVTLTLGGLEGTRTITPKTPARSQVALGAQSAGMGPAAFLTSAANPVGGSGGMLYANTLVDGQGPGAVQVGTCWFPDGASTHPVFQQNCQGAQPGVSNRWVEEPKPVLRSVRGAAFVLPRGTWETGGYVRGMLAEWQARHVSVSLDFTAPAPPTDTTDPGGADDTPPPTTGPSGDDDGADGSTQTPAPDASATDVPATEAAPEKPASERRASSSPPAAPAPLRIALLGTARRAGGALAVRLRLPGAGTLSLTAVTRRGLKVASVRRSVARAGTLQVVLRAKPGALRQLRRRGALAATLRASFRRAGDGRRAAIRMPVTFRLRRAG